MKILASLFFLLAILGAGAAASFFLQARDSRAQLAELSDRGNARVVAVQTKLAAANTEIQSLTARLTELDGAIGEAKSKATSSDAQSVQLARDVAQLRAFLAEKDQTEQALAAENAQLKKDLAAARAAAANISRAEVDAYKQTIAKQEVRITDLEGQLRRFAEAAQKVAAEALSPADAARTIVAEPPVPAALRGRIGQVTTVGEKNAFVVISLGSNQGVLPNHRFSLSRGIMPLATVRVSSVQPDSCVAQVLPETLRGSLIKGDTAVILAK